MSDIVCKFVQNNEGYLVQKTSIQLVMIRKKLRGQIKKTEKFYDYFCKFSYVFLFKIQIDLN